MIWLIKHRLKKLIQDATRNDKLCDVFLEISKNKKKKINTTGKIEAGELLEIYRIRSEYIVGYNRPQLDHFLNALELNVRKRVRLHGIYNVDDKDYFILTDDDTKNILSFFSINLDKSIPDYITT